MAVQVKITLVKIQCVTCYVLTVTQTEHGKKEEYRDSTQHPYFQHLIKIYYHQLNLAMKRDTCQETVLLNKPLSRSIVEHR